MKTDLYGDMIHEPEDFLDTMLWLFKTQKHCGISYRPETKMGFTKNIDLNLGIRGLYILYRNEVPIYIGLAEGLLLTIHTRVGRYFSTLNGTNRLDEKHCGASRNLKLFGNSDKGMSVKAINITVVDNILKDSCVTLGMLENLLIRTLNPTGNIRGKGSRVLTSKIIQQLYMPYNTLSTVFN